VGPHHTAPYKGGGGRSTWYEVHLRRHRPHRQTIILSREGALPATGSPLPSPSPLDVTPTLPPDFTASKSPTPTPRRICLPPPRPTVSYLEATGSILLAAERGEESKFTSVASHLRFNQRSPRPDSVGSGTVHSSHIFWIAHWDRTAAA
jgi:hypothetical protein